VHFSSVSKIDENFPPQLDFCVFHHLSAHTAILSVVHGPCHILAAIVSAANVCYHFKVRIVQGWQTCRFWRDSTKFESCVPCPAWICGRSHICTALRNFWITLTNGSKDFSCAYFPEFCIYNLP
jgi:hypothetical protein